MKIKWVTMATSHKSPSSDSCHTEFSVDNKCTYLDIGPTMNQEAGEGGGGGGVNQRQKRQS